MSTKQFMQQDTEARQKIVENIRSNFFVEAGAGSGKTTILVKRMVAMVEQGMNVRHICAITFTKAAAGEFYERFQKALIQRSTAETKPDFKQEPGELGNPTDQTRENCIAALNDLDLCFMGTTDSFCNMILSEHPAKAGIPSDAAVLSDEDMQAQYKKAYSAIQKGAYGAHLQQLCRRFRAFHSNPDSLFSKAIGTLMDTRNCEYVFAPAPKCDVDTYLKDEKAQLLSVLRTLLAHQELRHDGTKDSKSGWQTLIDKEHMLFSSWQDNAGRILRVLKSIGNIRLIPETDLSIFGPIGETVFQLGGKKGKWYEFSDDGVKRIVNKLQDLQYSVTLEFLTAASSQIAERLRKEGKLTFFDYLLYLRNVLKEDAKNGGALIRHIYDRHKYFLIDEFQDTNPMQAEIFFYLTAQNIQPDWRKCVPHPGSLFIVGDPKQSIYRFRYADVSAFLQIKELFTGDVGEVVNLTRNFRSTHKMRSWFNHAFSTLLPDDTAIQSKYAPIPLEDAPPPDGTFEGIYSYEEHSGKNAAPEELDHAQVAKIIRQIVNNPAYEIVKRDEGRCKVRYKDIMIITPTKSKMGNFIQCFAQQGIPFRIEGKVLFSQCPSLVALSRIFAAVANPGSLLHLYGALTCQRFGFDLNTLHRLETEGFRYSLYAEHSEAEPVSEALTLLKMLVQQSHQLSAAALFGEIIHKAELFKYVSAEKLEYLYFALELLRSAECSGQFATFQQAADYLDMLITDSSGTERAISLTKDEDRVHIANLHKVKGLEAPVVILAAPHKNDRTPGIRVQQSEPAPQCWLFSVKDNDHFPLFSCSGFEAEKDTEKACMEAEEKRLLYVAATRAQRVLIVADAINAKGESNEKNPWKFFVDRCEGDFFRCLPVGKIAPVATKTPIAAQELYDSAANLLQDTSCTEKSYAIVRPSQIKLKGKTASEDNFEDAQTPAARTHTVRSDAAVVGTLVHSLMEALVSSRNTVPLESLARDITAEYEAEGEQYRQLLTKVGTTVQNGGFPQLSAAPPDILPALLRADEVYCEVPFCRKSGDEIWHGIMDVVYRVGPQWFILDYKTNADGHDLDVKYRQQLDAYVEAFRDMTGHSAIPLIYHIDV